MNHISHKIIAALILVALVVPSGAFAQYYDPNGSSQTQGANDNTQVNNNATNQNSDIYTGTSDTNTSAQNQGAADNTSIHDGTQANSDASVNQGSAANTSNNTSASNQNSTVFNGTQASSDAATNQGGIDSFNVNFDAANQAPGIYNGTSESNSNAYSSGSYDAGAANYNGLYLNNSLPNPSIYNQWISSQAQAGNTKASTAAQNANSKIGFDIYDPNKSYTDLNADLYNAGKTANQNIDKTGCSVSIKKFADIFIAASCIINRFLVSIALSFAMVYFIWGVVQYVLSSDSVEERKKSKQVMLWGVLIMFVIVSVWGLVGFTRTLFGF